MNVWGGVIKAVLTPCARTLIVVSIGLLTVLPIGSYSYADDVIPISGDEEGLSLGGNYQLWHDPSATARVEDAIEAYTAGEFSVPASRGSTGLAPGSFWSYFKLKNTTDRTIELHLEYIDHQLIFLRAYRTSPLLPSTTAQPAGSVAYESLAELNLTDDFSDREVPHHRFVVPAELKAGETAEFLIQYGSHQMGFVFPALRIWSTKNLAKSQANELLTVTLIVGGLLVMALTAFGGGLATGGTFFYVYAFHALASIAVWFTVLGFTHQFLITSDFHWRYMSITSAAALFSGLMFAREFLNTRQFLPKFNYLLLFLMANSVFLLVAALLEQITLALVSITLALLLYPVVSIAGFLRWMQGAREAMFFTLAWTLMVIGLFMQALRDLGLVEHNFVNYYWPAVASYGEMAVILLAMGIRIRDLREEKVAAEKARVEQLKLSQESLQAQVAERTQELEAAKTAAEVEARTDALTGINNRRSFMAQGKQILEGTRIDDRSINLLMLDIDHFKDINDRYGHDVGDRALVAFADEVKNFCRERDLFGRIGGEEFALILVSPEEAACETANRLRERIASIKLDVEGSSVRFTTSIGIAHRTFETSVEDLLKRADSALYDAKHAGRNRVKVALA